jgi:hypothetical protein
MSKSNPKANPATTFNSLQGIYHDFITTDEIATTTIQSNSSIGSAEDFNKLIELLFPKEPGGFFAGSELWKKLSGIATEPREFNDRAGTANFLAQKLRFYYYDGTSTGGNGGIENAIQNFYLNNGRPSAYNHVGKVQDAAGKTTQGFTTEGTLRSLLEASKPVEGSGVSSNLKTALTMILVDTPSIDLKMRNADVTSTFMNYMPSVMASQMVPYLDVRFVFDRKITRADEQNRTLTTMSQLKFLMGSEPIKEDSATALIYDTLVQNNFRKVYNFNITPEELAARRGSNKLMGKPRQLPALNAEDASLSEQGNQTVTTGMELFTMPQTMINMDYDQATTPRYNQVLNQTLPFGTISSVSINIAPSTGLFSFKTATLTLKIFDRSRLVEIADFLNPKLYQAATVWMTYGWRAPTQTKSQDENSYNSFINENMMKREAYGIRNSSISIDSSGVATVTLSLFTKGAAEMVEVSPTVGSAAYELEQSVFEAKLRDIKALAEELGLANFSSGAKDVRGSQVINAALGGTFPNIDKKVLDSELSTLRSALQKNANPKVSEFLSKVETAFGVTGKDTSKTQLQVELDVVAQRTAKNRFDALKSFNAFDFFAVKEGKFDKDAPKPEIHPLTKLYETVGRRNNPRNGAANLIKGYGDVSFARLFATYFASAARTLEGAEPIVDEYQIIFYNFNDYAGLVANVNIGDFPIDVDALEKAYAERVVQQKGEKMTLVNFLEVVRSSQFGDVRNKAFGFSDLYDEKGQLKKGQDDVLLQRQVSNEGLGSAFVIPAVDFYIETGFLNDGGNATADLLTSFEAAAISQASGKKSGRAAGTTRIIRIHVYDKAGTPHKAATDILRDDSGAFVEVESSWQSKYRSEAKQVAREINPTAAPKTQEQKNNTQAAINEMASPSDTNISVSTRKVDQSIPLDTAGGASRSFSVPLNVRSVGFGSKGGDAKIRFETVKREISRFVPTIIAGTNGTAVKNVSYTSNQDALLSTIMMLRNKQSADNPSLPNGSGVGDLPLRVIPGQLSLTTMGCPTIEYMQQFFVDLGTGTTIDNLYNVVGLTHTIAPGNFTTEIKFGFYDAYGKYEGASSFSNSIIATMKKLSKESQESTQIENRQRGQRR